ncbi:hypothetical protein FA13DRAFT_1818773 [Coprinellus micaceus]|uniref:Uncharacterized protein n=1 Tax=Coprinellus micaceus TaxID=71717 RepID=A0A4Y7SM14_COPMI|nr:hypothetical protein FA13DRAFT_1818773 [Coprinellus micaceus]
MPEKRELMAHHETAEYYREEVLEGECLVEDMWLDTTGTGKEKPAHGPDNRQVFRVSRDDRLVRGSKSGQTSVVPEIILWPALPEDEVGVVSAATPPSVSDLELRWAATHADGRALYLDFGSMFLKLAPLTHTSIQCYTRERWEKSVTKVDKGDRGFKVGLALEFKHFFIAFVSHDLVFQPQWFRHDPNLVGKSVVERFGLSNDVLRDYRELVRGIVGWMKERRSRGKKRTSLACDSMRNSNVWIGLGVYSVSEVFNIAGVSPLLTEKEVFDCPSRASRLCEAFWMFSHSFKGGFKKYVKPAICRQTHLLAPTMAQRLKYQDALSIYGKTDVRMSARRGALVRQYKAKLEEYAKLTGPLYRDEIKDLPADAFEPDLVIDALTLSDPAKGLAYGHLIFGLKKWKSFGFDYSPDSDDPLTELFTDLGLWNADPAKEDMETHLNLDAYEDLRSPEGESWCTFNTYLYSASKNMWSPVPDFPQNIQNLTRPSPKARPKPKQQDSKEMKTETKEKEKKEPVLLVPEDKKQKQLFRYIVENTKGVAIGPLEYAGHGRTLKGARGSTVWVLIRSSVDRGPTNRGLHFRRFSVNGDPMLSPYYQVMSLWPVIAGKGENQQKMSNAQQKQLVKRAAKSLRSSSPPRSSSPQPSPSKVFASVKWLKRGLNKENPTTPPRKKFKRLHDDRRMSMEWVSED